VPTGGSRGTALLILNLGARRGWVVSTTPRPLYPRERSGSVACAVIVILLDGRHNNSLESLCQGHNTYSTSIIRTQYPLPPLLCIYITSLYGFSFFERKILRKIYGPVQEGDTSRIRYNEELNRSIKGEDIVKFIKAQRIIWLGHVKGMEAGGNAKKNDGRKTVYRKKERKASFEMNERCSSRFESNEDKTADRESRV
jgi:hypothetical protein